MRQIITGTASHTAEAPVRTIAAFSFGRNFPTTNPKHAGPTPPIAAPAASNPAACLPRIVPRIPAFRFFSRACNSTSVALQGKIAGKARESHPIVGLKRIARRPATMLTAPPNPTLAAYSCHFVLRSADQSTEMFLGFTGEISPRRRRRWQTREEGARPPEKPRGSGTSSSAGKAGIDKRKKPRHPQSWAILTGKYVRKLRSDLVYSLSRP
jgi:hypothetical protein